MVAHAALVSWERVVAAAVPGMATAVAAMARVVGSGAVAVAEAELVAVGTEVHWA